MQPPIQESAKWSQAYVQLLGLELISCLQEDGLPQNNHEKQLQTQDK